MNPDNVIAEQRLPLSICMIAGAEAHCIRRTLESVAGWVEEIIVVINDDVTDGTDQIAAACGAKVFREPWKGYVRQKNSAAQKAGQEWILSLDADEVVSPELRDEIRNLFSRPGKLRPFAAFSFPRCTFYGGRWIRHGDWYPDRKIRMWRRGSAEWRGKNVHETVVVQGAVGKCRKDLFHYTAETIDRHIAKISRYTEEFARDAVQRGSRAGAFDLLARPAWRLIRAYFLRLGFLDGWQGAYIAWTTAFYTATRYAKIRVAQDGH